LPHLFLRSAQKDHIAGKAALASENPASKIEQLPDRRGHRLAVTDVIAKIDDPVTLVEALANQIMQADEPLRLGMNGGDGPNPLRGPQGGKQLRGPGPAQPSPRLGAGRRPA
jgi:hypothetical protein